MKMTAESFESYLRTLPSDEAAAWLISTYPRNSAECGEAIRLLRSRSWSQREQFTLARHYLRGLPHASAVAYQAFASFMAVPSLVQVLSEQIPESIKDRNLLEYYLSPVLIKMAKNEKDAACIRNFTSKLAGGKS